MMERAQLPTPATLILLMAKFLFHRGSRNDGSCVPFAVQPLNAREKLFVLAAGFLNEHNLLGIHAEQSSQA